ncbi:unnamed protein product [Caenorhabditis nigoni]
MAKKDSEGRFQRGFQDSPDSNQDGWKDITEAAVWFPRCIQLPGFRGQLQRRILRLAVVESIGQKQRNKMKERRSAVTPVGRTTSKFFMQI